MKIFLIGFNKCGTCSFFDFFSRNGIKSYHPGKCGGQHLNLINERFARQEKLLKGLDYNFYCDLDLWWPKLKQDYENKIYLDIDDYSQFPYTHARIYKCLDTQYPNSKFILNTRDVGSWIKSRQAHSNGAYINWFKKFYNTTSDRTIIERWKKEREIYHEEVKRYFTFRENQLLVYNIQTSSPQEIKDFLGKPNLNVLKFPHKNITN